MKREDIVAEALLRNYMAGEGKMLVKTWNGREYEFNFIKRAK